MGFFNDIFGGSNSVSNSQNQSSQSSGYGALPSFAKNAYANLVSQTTPLFAKGAGTAAYTPIPQTAQETQAYGLAQLPTTQQGVSDLTNNYLNPLQNYITQGIAQNYAAGNSAYNSAVANDGAMGSNRQYVNDAYNDQLQNQAIGSSLANAYQGAQTTALGQNQQTIQDLLTQGSNQRSLAQQTAQAPMSALQAYGQLLGLFPQSSTGSSTGSSNATSSTTKGVIGGISQIWGGG